VFQETSSSSAKPHSSRTATPFTKQGKSLISVMAILFVTLNSQCSSS